MTSTYAERRAESLITLLTNALANGALSDINLDSPQPAINNAKCYRDAIMPELRALLTELESSTIA